LVVPPGVDDILRVWGEGEGGLKFRLEVPFGVGDGGARVEEREESGGTVEVERERSVEERDLLIESRC
jgi:hypothetical protein